MRLLHITIFLFFSVVTTTWASGVGAIVRTGADAETRQEIGFFRQEIEWTLDSSDISSTTATQNMVYLQVDYLLDHNWTAFFRVGAADLLMESVAPPDFAEVGRDLEGDVQAWGGIGLKGLLMGGGKPLGLGVFAEGRYFGPYEDDKSIIRNGNLADMKMEVNKYWAAQVGLPLQLRLPGFAVYTGPHVAASGAELELTTSGLGAVDHVLLTCNEDPSVGIVAGASLLIGNSARISIDGRFGGGSTSWGILFNFSPLY